MHSPNRHSTTTQLLHNHFATIIPRPNHDSTTLRVESMNDFDSTIPHSRFSKSNRFFNHNPTMAEILV